MSGVAIARGKRVGDGIEWEWGEIQFDFSQEKDFGGGGGGGGRRRSHAGRLQKSRNGIITKIERLMGIRPMDC